MSSTESIFYNTDNLSMKEKVSLLKKCKDVSYMWWADRLDCSVSIARQKMDCTFEEILGHLKEDAHFVVVDRGTWGRFDDKEHFEIGFRAMDAIDYFLFVEVESDKMSPILDKYHLIPLHTL